MIIAHKFFCLIASFLFLILILILIVVFIFIVIIVAMIIDTIHIIIMEKIFMNTEHSKTNESHRFKLDLADKLNLKNPKTWI